jgi:peptidoglycan/LPS O-acetylase OafA/YrhL
MPKGLPGFAGFLLARGDQGVLMFFVLSGFLITHLLRREFESTGGIKLSSFYLRRTLRIFPAFYFYLGTVGVLTLMGILAIRGSDFLWSGSYLWNYKHLWASPDGTGAGGWFLGHFWSLSLEEQFYLCWPVTLILVGMRRALWVCIGLIIASPLLRVATYFLFPGSRGQVLMMLHTGADAIMFGCAIALSLGKPQFEDIMSRFQAPIWPFIWVIFGFFLLPRLGGLLPGHLAGGFGVAVGNTISGLSIAFLVSWLLRNPNSLAGRVLNTRPMAYVGVLSYSIYLWQQLFLTPLNHTWTGCFPWNVACTLIAAQISYWLVERPFLQVRRRFQMPEIGSIPQTDKFLISC